MAKKKLRDITVGDQTWKWYVKQDKHDLDSSQLIIFDSEKKRHVRDLTRFDVVTPNLVKEIICEIKILACVS